MNIEEIREYCLSLPMVTEDMAFGEDHLLFRVFNKIFACLSLDHDRIVALKSDPDFARELRDKYSDITPAYHWNKKYWSQLYLDGALQPELIKSLLSNSYCEVVAKLPRKYKLEHPEIINPSLTTSVDLSSSVYE